MSNQNILKKYTIESKLSDYAKWYKSVLCVSDMIDYTDVGGCYVLKPLAYDIWENIRIYLDAQIKTLEVENCYFPLFLTKTNLEKESNHFSDFTPEVAWIVTEDPVIEPRTRKDPEILELVKKLNDKGIDVHLRTKHSERYAIRPTSETIIYPHFSQWIKKNAKYPKINQWANVVRWENKETTPFIRSKEFLWQEGHTCHKTKDEAMIEVFTVLDIYKNLYKELLAVPMIPGIKTKSETFPGAEITATIEGFLPDSGKGIQSATSHYLGQKFAQIFNIKNSDNEFVHQNSWGLTTRSIGIMVMTHSDDRGLVLPPRIAQIQIVLIACGLNSKTTEKEHSDVNYHMIKLRNIIAEQGYRIIYDSDISESPGMKFNKWETRGVPLRIELGPKDIVNNTIVFVRRDKPAKVKDVFALDKIDGVFVKTYLDQMHNEMYDKAFNLIKQNIVYCSEDSEIIKAIREKKLVLVDWLETDRIKTDTDSIKTDTDRIKTDTDSIKTDIDENGILEQRLKQLCKDADINSTKILCIPTDDMIKQFGFYTENKKFALFGKSY